MLYLGYVAWLAAVVCFIIELIKQFKTAGAVHGIIGIITCSLWTLIWGWMNSGKLGIRNIMLIWTLLIIVCIVLNVMSGALTLSGHLGT
jgi:hypothetical protein